MKKKLTNESIAVSNKIQRDEWHDIQSLKNSNKIIKPERRYQDTFSRRVDDSVYT